MHEFITSDYGEYKDSLYFVVNSTFECERIELKEKLGKLVKINGKIYEVKNIELHAILSPIYVGRLLGLIVKPYKVEIPYVIIANRYLFIIQNELQKSYQNSEKNKKLIHLTKMLKAGLDYVEIWPTEKLYTWLGHVAGSMDVYNIINIDEERNFSRPLFHAYYESKGIKIPETINLNEY